MRLFGSLLFPAIVLPILLGPSIVWASAHSSCITGDPLPSSTSDIVNAVCSQNGYGTCCTQRWSLSCVEKASQYARTTGLNDDLCGETLGPRGMLQVRHSSTHVTSVCLHWAIRKI
jgi:hypothetical protein